MAQTHKIGPLDGFPVGEFRIVTVDGKEIGILRLKDGEVHAVRNICPHKTAPVCRGYLGGTWLPSDAGGDLKYGRQGEVLVCPRHGWEFDIRTGNELFHEPPARLLKYPAKIEANEILITI
jgi:nitrite reductase (NADH) small subunit